MEKTSAFSLCFCHRVNDFKRGFLNLHSYPHLSFSIVGYCSWNESCSNCSWDWEDSSGTCFWTQIDVKRSKFYSLVFLKKKNTWIIENFENHNENYLAADVDLIVLFSACQLLLIVGNWKILLNSTTLAALVGWGSWTCRCCCSQCWEWLFSWKHDFWGSA